MTGSRRIIGFINVGHMIDHMFMLIFLDTDRNPATGDQGALGSEYVIELDPGAVGLFQWNGSDYARAPSQTFTFPLPGLTTRWFALVTQVAATWPFLSRWWPRYGWFGRPDRVAAAT